VCARSSTKGKAALEDLQSRNLPGTAEYLPLDITDDKAIDAAAASVEKIHGKLDILVNNAAIAVPTGTLREQMQEAFNINATGPAVLAYAMLPLLKKSDSPLRRIINISSGAGSIGSRLNPASLLYKYYGYPYRTSKTALNMVMANQFVEFGEFGIKVFAYDPGFTVSNLSENNTKANGARDVELSVTPLVDVLEGKRDDEVGKFLHNTGGYSW
jgi:NAD(P)-dependent dehydrogenase (short-subunit alcohol dehydrogenase family)